MLAWIALAVLCGATLLTNTALAGNLPPGGLSDVLAQATCNTTATATLIATAGTAVNGTVTVNPPA